MERKEGREAERERGKEKDICEIIISKRFPFSFCQSGEEAGDMGNLFKANELKDLVDDDVALKLKAEKEKAEKAAAKEKAKAKKLPTETASAASDNPSGLSSSITDAVTTAVEGGSANSQADQAAPGPPIASADAAKDKKRSHKAKPKDPNAPPKEKKEKPPKEKKENKEEGTTADGAAPGGLPGDGQAPVRVPLVRKKRGKYKKRQKEEGAGDAAKKTKKQKKVNDASSVLPPQQLPPQQSLTFEPFMFSVNGAPMIMNPAPSPATISHPVFLGGGPTQA